MNYRDEFNILHHIANPSPESSENGPFFTGLYAILAHRLGRFTVRDAESHLTVLRGLFRNGNWYTTPVTLNNERFSHDNFTGVVCLLIVLRNFFPDSEEVQEWCNAIPWLHKQLDHPRDIAFVWWFKMPYVFWFLLPICWGAMFVSCYQGHKKRGGELIAKTDGKLLALARCYAGRWSTIYKICSALVKKRRHTGPLPRNNWHMVKKYYRVNKQNEKVLTSWSWDTWGNVSYDYFFDINHPINELLLRSTK